MAMTGSASATARTVTKAVIPAAGLGTRFLPATKATPKEMLPIVDTPVIQYVVEEAVRAGLTDVLLVVGRGKRPLEDHFDRAPELEDALATKGDHARLAMVRHSENLADMHFVRQGQALGLGHAVLCARRHVGRQPFAVLLGDDLIDERDPLLEPMLEAQSRYGGSVIALLEVPREHIQRYGCAATAGAPDETGLVQITDLVEKPDPAEAPSNLAIIGRYVLSPQVFEALERTPAGSGGEIQLTDALRVLARRADENGEPVHGLVFSGRRYDTGDRADYLKTVIQLACERPDLGPELLAWLVGFVAERTAAARP